MNANEETAFARYLEHDVRKASIHEAAHIVIARRYGVWAQAYLVPTGTLDPFKEKSIVGQTMFGSLDSHRTKMVCLAGTIAEELEADPDLVGSQMFEALDDGILSLSESDAKGAGDYTVKDLDDCIELLRGAWKEIEEEAALLATRGIQLYRQMQEVAHGC